MPLAVASISITALSLSTANRFSPTCTVSPSCLIHSVTRPVSIVQPSRGMVTLMAISFSTAHRLLGQEIANRRDDALCVRYDRRFKRRAIWCWRMDAVHTLNRRIQVVERALHHLGRDLRADAVRSKVFVDDQQAPGLVDGC